MANIEHLKDLKEVVRKVSDDNFEMSVWGRRFADDCKTIACAAGWYVITYPDRIKHKWYGDNEGFILHTLGIGHDGVYNALMEHFDISLEETISIFDPNGYPEGYSDIPISQEQVLERIQRVIDAHRKEEKGEQSVR